MSTEPLTPSMSEMIQRVQRFQCYVHRDPFTVADITSNLHVDSGTATRILVKMQDLGLVFRADNGRWYAITANPLLRRPWVGEGRLEL